MVFPYFGKLTSNSIHPFLDIVLCVLKFHYFTNANESTLYMDAELILLSFM